MKYRKILPLIIPLLFFLFTPHFGIRFLSLSLLLIFLLSFLYSWISWSCFNARRLATIRRTYSGQNLEIELEIANTGLLPIYQLCLRDQHGGLGRDQEHKKLQERMAGRSHMAIKYMIKGRKRGTYTMGPLVARGVDPLGLFPWQKTCSDTELIIIYPRVFPLLGMEDDKGLPAGNLKTENPVFEDTTQYKSIREYIPGDDLRRINWNVSARMGNLYTMQFTPSLHYAALILLDITLDAYPIRMRYFYLEKAIETAASLTCHCVLKKQEAALLTAGVLSDGARIINTPLRKDENHAVQILEILARISPSSQKIDPLLPLTTSRVKLPWGCRVLYVGPPPGDEQLQQLLGLAKKGLHPELFISSPWQPERKPGLPVHLYTDYEGIP